MLKFVFVKPPEIPWIIKNYLVRKQSAIMRAIPGCPKQISSELSPLEPDLAKDQGQDLVLWGDRDRVIDVSAVQVLEKGLPDCTAVIMKDCGHLPMIERPQESAEHYLAFLKSR